MERTKALNLATTLLVKHGLAAKGWRFDFDGARSRGGQCRHRDKVITMSRYLVPMWSEDEVRDTLTHEIAHALVGPGQGHGAVWARKMRELGARPERTHKNVTVEPRFSAVCTTHGTLVKRHRRTRNLVCVRCRMPVIWVDNGAARV